MTFREFMAWIMDYEYDDLLELDSYFDQWYARELDWTDGH